MTDTNITQDIKTLIDKRQSQEIAAILKQPDINKPMINKVIAYLLTGWAHAKKNGITEVTSTTRAKILTVFLENAQGKYDVNSVLAKAKNNHAATSIIRLFHPHENQLAPISEEDETSENATEAEIHSPPAA